MLFNKFLLVGTALLGKTAASRPSCPESLPDLERYACNANRTLSLGYLVFNGYTPLDLWGPLQILTSLSSSYPMTLSIISNQTGPITSGMSSVNLDGTTIVNTTHIIASSLLATHTPITAPPLDLLMIPGGFGSWAVGAETWMEDFILARFNSTDYVASVCSGSLTLARAGVLEGRRATTNKWGWAWIVQFGENVAWVPSARWTRDGKVWTSSGVAAGIDMTYALARWMYGGEVVNATMNDVELSPHLDEHWDPYSVVHKVPGADTSRPLKELVGPVGYDDHVPDPIPDHVVVLKH